MLRITGIETFPSSAPVGRGRRRTRRSSRRRPRCWFLGSPLSLSAAAAAELGRSAVEGDRCDGGGYSWW